MLWKLNVALGNFTLTPGDIFLCCKKWDKSLVLYINTAILQEKLISINNQGAKVNPTPLTVQIYVEYAKYSFI